MVEVHPHLGLLCESLPKQQIEMILRNSKLNTEVTRNGLLGYITVPKQRGHNSVRRVIESIREWGQIALLLLKLFKLSKKVEVLTLERENLLRERRDLLIQKRDLQVEKVDHVFAESRSADNAEGVFSEAGGAHSGSSSFLANSCIRSIPPGDIQRGAAVGRLMQPVDFASHFCGQVRISGA